ncbi:hypothetical protein LX32DRAFT_600579, partial [Colletotrichum zoysiae]
NKPSSDGFTLVVYLYPIMTVGTDIIAICSCACTGGTVHEGIPHRLRHGGSYCNIQPRSRHTRSGR